MRDSLKCSSDDRVATRILSSPAIVFDLNRILLCALRLAQTAYVLSAHMRCVASLVSRFTFDFEHALRNLDLHLVVAIASPQQHHDLVAIK
jgi:hypothetical protein